MNIKSQILTINNDLKECFEIRYEVFVNEQGFDAEIELDEYDDIAYHVLLSTEDKFIATARFFLVDNYYKIGRVCVLKDYRKLKLGNMLLGCIEDYISNLEIKDIYLNAQYESKGFYLKNGYKEVGEIFYEEGCKHIKMFKRVDNGN